MIELALLKTGVCWVYESMIVRKDEVFKLKSMKPLLHRSFQPPKKIHWTILNSKPKISRILNVCLNIGKLGAIFILRKGKGVGGITKYLLFFTGVGGWFWIALM